METKINRDMVRELRLKRSWSQEKLAEEAGVSPRTIQRVEAEGIASLQTRQALASALNIEASVLLASTGARPAEGVVPVRLGSRAAFRIWWTSRFLALVLLWMTMALIGLGAFVMAFGGVFFWESTDLSASQSAGAGLLSALLLAGVWLLVRWPYKALRRLQIVRPA